MRDRPAERIRLIGYTHGRSRRVPKLLAAGMPQLADQARARVLDRAGGASKTRVVDVVVARHDGAVGERLRIDGDHLADEEPGASARARRQKVDPALGDPVAGAEIGQRRAKRNAIANLTIADPNGCEKVRKTHAAVTPRCEVARGDRRPSRDRAGHHACNVSRRRGATQSSP